MMRHAALFKLLTLCLFYFMAVFVSGCVGSIRELPDSSFQSSAEMSLVFGRIEVIKDGQPVQLVPKGLKQIYYHLEIRREGGERHHILVSRRDGYFAAALPPGKYVINFGYGHTDEVNIFLTTKEIGKIRFDVIPSNATYIGSIRLIVVRKYLDKVAKRNNDSSIIKTAVDSPAVSGLAVSGIELMKDALKLIDPKGPGWYLISASGEIRNEFEEASKAFAILYPNHLVPIERLGKFDLDTERGK